MDSPSRVGLAVEPSTTIFAAAPASWYYLGPIDELSAGPRAYDLPGGRRFVAFLTADGRPTVLAARCAHMGADLAQGCIRAGRLVCPLHGWEYGEDGHCTRIPAAERELPPAFARQARYPATNLGGQIFFFNETEARFPAPFFDGVQPDQLRAARPFDLRDNVPWYFIGANGFDVQHFRNAHDRVLLNDPEIDAVDPFARRITLRLGVAGTSLADQLTRRFAGPEVTMTIAVWGGTLIFVTARFRRTTTYGLMTVRPLERDATHCRVVVWVRASEAALGRHVFDPLNAAIRRRFIRRFLQSDLGRMTGVRHAPARLIAADKPFAEYMEWLRQIHR